MSHHDAFASALLAPEATCNTGVFSRNGADPASRFAVYRNNVHSSLINALAAGYPVTRQLVGEAFFQAMAGVYVQAFPPTSRLINAYGRDFADFIQGFGPAASVPYLADVARLERLRVEAYHAADAQPLDQPGLIDSLQQQPCLGKLRLRLHPSVATLSSSYAVVALWAAHQTQADLSTLDPLQPQSALVLRRGLAVQVLNIDRGTATFIHCLNNGGTLEMAVACAVDTAVDFDLHHSLALLINQDAITHLHPEPKVSP